MTLYSASRNLPIPADEVFDFLADARHLTDFSSGVADVEAGHRPPGPGAAYRYRFPGRRHYHRLTCTVFRRPRLVEFRGDRMWTPLGTLRPTYSFRLEPAPDGCRVVFRVRVDLGGAMGLLRPVVRVGWRRDLPEDAGRLALALGVLPLPECTPETEPALRPMTAPAAVAAPFTTAPPAAITPPAAAPLRTVGPLSPDTPGRPHPDLRTA